MDLLPSAVTPAVVTPELAAAAMTSWSSASRSSTLRSLAEGGDGAVLTAWLRALAVPLGMPDDACAQWLAAVAVLASADEGSVTAGEVRDAVFGAVDDEDADERADGWLADWTSFGALVPVGDSADVPAGVPAGVPGGVPGGGVLRITPLGRLLADSVTATLAPAPDEGAAAVVQRFITVPVRVAIRYLTGWLAARGLVAATGELIDFAAAATPYQRATAIDLAAELGPDAAAAWRQRAKLPGYGAYVREWLADQGEEVPDVPGDEAWMAAEMFALAVGEAPPSLDDKEVVWAMEEAFDTADPVTVLNESGHPEAARLIELVQLRRGT